MAALTMDMIEQRLAEHAAHQERLFEPENLHRAHGQRPLWRPPIRSAFEEVVENLGLRKSQWRCSGALRSWAAQNKNRHFVPEELLNAWGMTVDLDWDTKRIAYETRS